MFNPIIMYSNSIQLNNIVCLKLFNWILLEYIIIGLNTIKHLHHSIKYYWKYYIIQLKIQYHSMEWYWKYNNIQLNTLYHSMNTPHYSIEYSISFNWILHIIQLNTLYHSIEYSTSFNWILSSILYDWMNTLHHWTNTLYHSMNTIQNTTSLDWIL